MNNNHCCGVSIVIPCYNDQDGLDRLLKSIDKNFPAFVPSEIIIVDDSSMVKISQATVRNKENQGPAKSRLRGAKLAKYDFLFFIDSDDLVEEGISSVFEQFPYYDLTLFGVRDAIGDREIRKWKPSHERPLYKNLHSWNLVIKKDVYLNAAVDTKSMAFEDWQVVLRAVSMDIDVRVNVLDDVIGKTYNISSNSLSRKSLDDQLFKLPDILKDQLICLSARKYIGRLLVRNAISRGVSATKVWRVFRAERSKLMYRKTEFIIDIAHGKVPAWVKLSVKRALNG